MPFGSRSTKTFNGVSRSENVFRLLSGERDSTVKGKTSGQTAGRQIGTASSAFRCGSSKLLKSHRFSLVLTFPQPPYGETGGAEGPPSLGSPPPLPTLLVARFAPKRLPGTAFPCEVLNKIVGTMIAPVVPEGPLKHDKTHAA